MPTQQYALEPNGPKRLILSWNMFWKNLVVSYDGVVLGSVPSKKELTSGQSFALPDGSAVQVQLVSGFGSTELRLTRNGQPLPGSAADPISRLNTAVGTVFFIAGLNIILGLVAEVFQVSLLQQLGLGISSIIFGLIFLVLGWFVKRHSLIALFLAIGLFIVDGLLGFVLAAAAGGNPGNAGLVMRVFLIIGMLQGVPALRQLKRSKQ